MKSPSHKNIAYSNSYARCSIVVFSDCSENPSKCPFPAFLLFVILLKYQYVSSSMCLWHANCLFISVMGGDVCLKKNRKIEGDR